MSNATRTSGAPALAPVNFASLLPVVAVDDETWQGSGVQPRDVLAGGFPQEQDTSASGACGSRDVTCIYLPYFEVVETDMRVEFVGKACGTFTVYTHERL